MPRDPDVAVALAQLEEEENENNMDEEKPKVCLNGCVEGGVYEGSVTGVGVCNCVGRSVRLWGEEVWACVGRSVPGMWKEICGHVWSVGVCGAAVRMMVCMCRWVWGREDGCMGLGA